MAKHRITKTTSCAGTLIFDVKDFGEIPIGLTMACNQASATVVCRSMDQSNLQLSGVLGLSGTCFPPKLHLPLSGIVTPT